MEAVADEGGPAVEGVVGIEETVGYRRAAAEAVLAALELEEPMDVHSERSQQPGDSVAEEESMNRLSRVKDVQVERLEDPCTELLCKLFSISSYQVLTWRLFEDGASCREGELSGTHSPLRKGSRRDRLPAVLELFSARLKSDVLVELSTLTK